VEYKGVVEDLFNVGMSFTGSRTGRTIVEGLKDVGEMVLEIEGEVGDWARREVRRGVWEGLEQ
jgi:hypothetical protein